MTTAAIGMRNGPFLVPGALSAVDMQDLGGDKERYSTVITSGSHLLKLNLSALVKICVRLPPAVPCHHHGAASGNRHRR
jgi:hypothetical protein